MMLLKWLGWKKEILDNFSDHGEEHFWDLKYFRLLDYCKLWCISRVFETTNCAKLLDLDLYTEFLINTKYH